jgi:hypothetical protein
MAIQNLINMSVPTDARTGALLMPKLQNRFRVSFDFDTGRYVTGNAVSVTRPTLSFDPVTLEVYNSRVYIPGKHTWSTVDIVVRDTVSNQTVKKIEEQLTRQIDMATQSVQRSAASFKFKTTIETLDGSNPVGGNLPNTSILDRWTLVGCYIENVAYGNNDYASSDPITISITVKYDNAIHAHGNDTDNLSVANFTPETDIASTGQGNFNTSNSGR